MKRSRRRPKGAKRLHSIAMGLALGVGGVPLLARQPDGPVILAPITNGDEPIVITRHSVRTPGGPLDYEARAGRLAIRNEQTGEVRGYVFFVAYHTIGAKATRPVTFLWNGGPTSPAWNIHTYGFGPRLRQGNEMVDNPQTLLAVTDLVFMDPVETGFSRPAKPEFAGDFLQFEGDVATTIEFIRSYRTRFRAAQQPLFIAGESWGVFRGSAVADQLIGRGVKLSGVMLISGDIPNIPQPAEFYDAMHVPARTAAAFYHKRLPPELMRDRAATLNEVVNWARTVYQPALARKDQLSDAERETVVQSLARYTGIPADMVDRKTLVVPVNVYLSEFLGADQAHKLYDHDMRMVATTDSGSPDLLDRYLREELSYTTDLAYRPIEKGWMPTPGPKVQLTSDQFYVNQTETAQEGFDAFRKTGEIARLARLNPPWIVDALQRDKSLHVAIYTGRYDPLNMCEGDVIVTATLSEDVRSRIFNRCYESGHSIYRDEAARLLITDDMARFIRENAGG